MRVKWPIRRQTLAPLGNQPKPTQNTEEQEQLASNSTQQHRYQPAPPATNPPTPICRPTREQEQHRMKLLTYPALFRAQKVLIASQYAGVPLEVDTNVTPELLKSKSPHGTVPVLETPQGVISESNAIARFVARVGKTGTAVYPADAFRPRSWIPGSTFAATTWRFRPPCGSRPSWAGWRTTRR